MPNLHSSASIPISHIASRAKLQTPVDASKMSLLPSSSPSSQSPTSTISKNTTPTPTSTFSPFTRLPAELRAIIWYFALPQARLVPIQYREKTCTYTSRIRSPALLHTRQESRAEAKKVYQELDFGELASRCEPGCWIDPSRDQIYLSTDIKPVFDHEGRMMPIGVKLDSPRYIHCSRMRALRGAGYNLKNLENVWFRSSPFRRLMLECDAAKRIVSDLLDTFIGLSILQDFVVDFEAWELIGDEIFRRRHEMKPFPIEDLTVVVERGDGPLVENEQLVDHEGEPCGGGDDGADGDGWPVCGNGLHEALAWQGYWYNMMDLNEGGEEVLRNSHDVKYLDTKEWVERQSEGN